MEQINPPENNFDEAKLDELIKLDNIEDCYLLIEAITDEQAKQYIEHFKKKKPEEQETKVGKIVHNSSTKNELINELKKEIVIHFKDRHKEISGKISEARKKGKDVDLDWIKLMSAPLKIKMYEATEQKKDFLKVKKILDEVEKSVSMELK